MYYYVLLAAAILLEVGGSSMLKYADGFSKIIPSAISVLFTSPLSSASQRH